MIETWSVKVNKRGQIAIPRSVMERLAIYEGDELVFEMDDDRITMFKKRDPVKIVKEIRASGNSEISMEWIKQQLKRHQMQNKNAWKRSDG